MPQRPNLSTGAWSLLADAWNCVPSAATQRDQGAAVLSAPTIILRLQQGVILLSYYKPLQLCHGEACVLVALDHTEKENLKQKLNKNESFIYGFLSSKCS